MFDAPPPGLAEPQPFGTAAPNEPKLATLGETALADPTIGEPVPPVELSDVEQPVAMVRAASRLVVLSGSGDGIVDASAAGLLHGAEAILYAADLGANDHAEDADQVIITDSNRDRAHQWRGTQDVVGFTETGGPQSDVLIPDTADQRLPVFADQSAVHQTTAAVDGLDIRATGYGEPFAYRPEDRPAMAVDGDPATAWVVADRFNPIGQSIEVSGDIANLSLLQSQQPGASRVISAVRLDFDGAGSDSGASQVADLDDRSLSGTGQPIEAPAGATLVRITITGVVPRPGGTDPGPSAVGFAELGLGAHREVVSLPQDTTGVSAGRRWRSSSPGCAPTRSTGGEAIRAAWSDSSLSARPTCPPVSPCGATTGHPTPSSTGWPQSDGGVEPSIDGRSGFDSRARSTATRRLRGRRRSPT
jgi:arabinofuranan 3-O-arabinosyltransferase